MSKLKVAFIHCVQVIFYCHFPDLLLAKHTSLLRRVYRKPIDWIEEKTTGLYVNLSLEG